MTRRCRLLVVVIAGVGLAAPATARAAPALTPSVVGETPVAGGVFRFPQAVAFSPGGAVVYVGDQYSGVVQSFGRDGTARGQFGSRAIRREAGRLGTVGGVATDRDGRVYVLDSENDRVQVFTPAGNIITSWGDSTLFDLSTNPDSVTAGISASGLAVAQSAPGAAPVVYVADQGKDRVDRFQLDPATLDPVGQPVFSDPGLGLAAPQGVALDPAATRVYVADDDNDRVVVLTPDTLAFVSQVGSHGTGPGQFQNPYDVAVDGAGQLYVGDNLNNRVDVFDAATLGFKATFGGFGRLVGGFSIVRSVGGLADDPRGGVDVADTANNRIQALDAAGDLLAAWGVAGRGAGYVTRPGGVAFTPDGGIAAADTFDHRIERFGPDGAFAGQLGLISTFNGFATAGSAPGQFNAPRGVAYDADGNAWIADTGNNRVQKESPGGAMLASFAASAPQGIAADGNGNVFVANTGAGNVLEISGGTSTVVRSGMTQPVAVAPDGAGGAYVADATSVLAPDGSTVAPPPGSTTWDHPSGLAFDPVSATLYVAEDRPNTAGGARIERFSAGAWDRLADEGTGAAQVIDPGGLALSRGGGTLAVADTGNNRVLRFDVAGRTPPPLPQLTVSVAPLTGGMVTSAPLGIACATDCAQHYSAGGQVTLTAQPAAGLVLTGWTGACAAAGTASTCTLTMAGSQTVGATFGAAPPPGAPPPPAAPSPPAARTPAPPVRIVSVGIVPRTLHRARPSRRGRAAQRATRARVTVRTTRSASLTILVQAGRPGVRRGSECVPPPRSGARRGRACTRFVTLRGTRTVRAPRRVARFVLTPDLRGRPLARGRYRLAVSALDTSGNRVGPKTAAFVVTR